MDRLSARSNSRDTEESFSVKSEDQRRSKSLWDKAVGAPKKKWHKLVSSIIKPKEDNSIGSLTPSKLSSIAEDAEISKAIAQIDTSDKPATGQSNINLKVQPATLDLLVEKILALPYYKIDILPESAVASAYKFVIQLIVELIYGAVWNLNGIEFFGHHLELEFHHEKISPELINTLSNMDPVNRKALSEMVDILLENEKLNISWLPDKLEKQLYLNVLVVLFSTIEVVSESLQLNLLGHVLKLDFCGNGKGYERLSTKGNSMVSEAHVDKMIDELLAQPEYNNKYIPDYMERSLYKSLYILILCAIQELFADLDLNILDDVFYIKLRPNVAKPIKAGQDGIDTVGEGGTGTQAVVTVQAGAASRDPVLLYIQKQSSVIYWLSMLLAMLFGMFVAMFLLWYNLDNLGVVGFKTCGI